MAEEILVNVMPREVRVAMLTDRRLQDIYIEKTGDPGLVGNIYKGKVARLLPGLQAAFVEIGLERTAFLHISDMPGQKDIYTALHVGQEILVQVAKEPLGSKGPRLTCQFTLCGRYLVFTPSVYQIHVSQKITDNLERQRLLSMITASQPGGYIFRTRAESITQSEIDEDKKNLTTLWAEVEARAKHAKVGDLVYPEIPLLLRVIRDYASTDVEKIWVDNTAAVSQMMQFATRHAPNLTERIEYYADQSPIFDMHAVEKELQNALERKIALKSGGHIIFDQTEAMITIDVNTGSYLGHHKIAQTILKTNLEAAEQIACQVRLRNLGGIIIIDFIDMENPADKRQLWEVLTAVLAKDSAKIEVSELSTLGLIQMTRKRTRRSLAHILCVPCSACQQRGSRKSLDTISYEIFRDIKRTATNYAWSGFIVLAANVVVKYLLEKEAAMLTFLETQLGKPILLQVESSYGMEQFDVLPKE